jgi:hypothetical protein
MPGPTLRAQTNSAPSSNNSGTPADDEGLRKACAEAVEELRAARKLIAAQGIDLDKLKELLALEQQISAGLKDLRNLDAGEKQALRDALDAKDRQIAALGLEITELKKNKWTFWKAVKTFAIGAAAGIIIAGVLRR